MIIPGPFEKNFEDVVKNIALVEGVAESFQIDIADNILVDGLTFLDIDRISGINTDLSLEIHLMVANPSKYLHKKIDGVNKILCQVEILENIETFLDRARELGYKTGLSINPETDYMVLNEYLDRVDFVQFMCVEPGAQGKKFVYRVLNKIQMFLRYHQGVQVQVDGGVNETTLPLLKEIGVNDFVVGSAIFRSSNPKEMYLKYTNMLNSKNDPVNTIIAAKEKIKQVAFLGGAAWKPGDEPYTDAYNTAKILAENGYEIVNGGGPGVMEASTEGAKAAGKQVLAVTYHPNKPKRHYEGVNKNNNFDTEVITLDYFDRTKVMLQTTQAHIVFRGSLGTLSEFGMSWISSWIHEPDNKPIILFGAFWQDFLDVIQKHMVIDRGEEKLLKICTTPEEVLTYLNSRR